MIINRAWELGVTLNEVLSANRNDFIFVRVNFGEFVSILKCTGMEGP